MRTIISTQHGTFTGRSVETIIRREYGRKSEFRGSADRNSPERGMVVRGTRGRRRFPRPRHRHQHRNPLNAAHHLACPAHHGRGKATYREDR